MGSSAFAQSQLSLTNDAGVNVIFTSPGGYNPGGSVFTGAFTDGEVLLSYPGYWSESSSSLYFTWGSPAPTPGFIFSAITVAIDDAT